MGCSPGLSLSRPFALLSLAAAVSLASPASIRGQTPDRPLQLGQPIERQIAAGEAHAYRVSLEAGQFMFVAVEQIGVDVAIVLYGPDGAALGEFDSPNGRRGLEPVSAVARASGDHRLEVRRFDGEAPPGRYTIRLERIQPAATTAAGKLDELFLPWDRPTTPGAAVVVVKDGAVVYRGGFGSANLEHGIPITPSTVFDIASVSKQFAGLAIAVLVEEGPVSLDADIREYLPEMPDFGSTVTVRHLVHHTSGLRDWTAALPIAGWRFEDVISFEDILDMARHQRDLNFEPGAEYSYSNTGYNLLAEIVTRVTGVPFAEWMQENVFEPLGMTRTHFHADHDRLVRDRADSYVVDDESGFRNVANNLTALGSSSLYTTAEDLAKWALNFETGQVGGKAALELMHQQGVLNSGQQIDYAFGQNVDSYRGARTVSHGGSWAGFRTHLIRFPEQRLAIVVLSNLGGFDAGGMARRIADIYLADALAPREARERPVVAAAEVEVSPETLEGYVGTYKLGPGWLLTITRDGDRLLAQATNEPRFPMTAQAENLFWVEAYGAAVLFPRDASGAVSHIEYRGIHAPRVELVNPTAAQLADYVGRYYSPELDASYDVVLQDGRLIVRHWKHDDITLTPSLRDEFTGSVWWFRNLEFVRGTDAQVTGLKVTNGRVRNLRFEKTTR